MKRKFSTWIDNCYKVAALCAVLSLTNGCTPNKKEITPTKNAKTEVSVKKVNNPTRTIRFINDTLNQRSSALLYYSNKKIVRNYVENNKLYDLKLYLLVHEDWHRHNSLINYRYKFNYTPAEYFKLCMHDEITANIASLLTLRYEYMGSKNKDQIITKYKNGLFGFYFTALQKKQINPFSNNKDDIEKEYSLIVNGMKNKWMKSVSHAYIKTHHKMLNNYINRKCFVGSRKTSYDYVKNYMYTIGGINFSQYMDEDIKQIDDVIKISDEINNVDIFKDCKNFVKDLDENYKLLEGISLDKRYEAYQHLFIAAKLKQKLQNVKKENIEHNPNIITSYYNNVLSSLSYCKEFKNLIDETIYYSIPLNTVNSSNEEYEKLLKKVYTVNGVDLRTCIQSFNPQKVPFFAINSYKDLTNAIWVMPTEVLQYIDASYAKKALSAPVIKPPYATENVNNKSTPVQKKVARTSGILTMIAPNFDEPILIANTPEQNQMIFKCIQDFDNIPEVLKSTRTQDIIKYNQQQSNKSR